jgi:serine/threonine-protein kinase
MQMQADLLRYAAFISALTLLSGVSNAQSPPRDPVGAQRLFSEARHLLDEGKYQEACQRLADSQQLDPGIGTLLNLAQCYVRIGKTATAWEAYHEAADAARAAGQTERESKAAHAAAALEPELAKCTITVPDAAVSKGVEVKRNGVQVPKSLWGVSEPVDPGEYLIEGRTRDGKTWSTRVKAEPGRVAIVVLPAFEEGGPLAGQPGQADSASGRSAQMDPPNRPIVGESHSNGARTAILVAEGVVTAAGLAVGFGFLLASNSAQHDLDDARSRIDRVAGTCRMPTENIQADCAMLAARANDPNRDSTIAAVGFATAGVAAVGLAATWLIWKPATGSAVSVRPLLGTRAASLWLVWKY